MTLLSKPAIFDTHVHSAASPDSTMKPEDAILVAKKQGIGIIFTEHCDYILSEGRNEGATDYWHNGKKDFVCDFDIYPHEYKKYRSESVLLGIEIGLTAAYLDKNKKTAQGDYDFIIGSAHSAGGLDVYFDTPPDYNEFISRYLTTSAKMVELCDFFDSFGHVDYVARYNTTAQRLFNYNNFAREFDELFRAIAQKDLSIEINTSGLSKFDNYEATLIPIYKRFAQLGGRHCTIGSDAHDTSRIGCNFETALEIADTCGLEVVYYEDRKRRGR